MSERDYTKAIINDEGRRQIRQFFIDYNKNTNEKIDVDEQKIKELGDSLNINLMGGLGPYLRFSTYNERENLLFHSIRITDKGLDFLDSDKPIMRNAVIILHPGALDVRLPFGPQNLTVRIEPPDHTGGQRVIFGWIENQG